MDTHTSGTPKFSGYQKMVVGVLAFLQCTVVLDFMLMSPLGAVIMPALSVTPAQFGTVVSAYAFAAGVSGLLTAGFADRFDRKKLLLVFYGGFIAGTAWCGAARSLESLLLARVVAGLFGGVVGSIVLAIATDLFAPQLRGRVLGFVQTAFSASQILGVPIGIYLSSRWNWHVPFFALAALSIAGGSFIALFMEPVADHLRVARQHSAFDHMLRTATEMRYLPSFVCLLLLAGGGFMLMPFSSAFAVNNLGISIDDLPVIYMVTGIATIFIGPLVGKAADSFGKLRVFLFGTAAIITWVLIYTNLGPSTLMFVTVMSVLLFVGSFSRMIPFQALMTQVPTPSQRGSFNAISTSVSQFAGALGSVVAGYIVEQGADGKLYHYEVAGYVVAATSLLASALLWRIHRGVGASARVMA